MKKHHISIAMTALLALGACKPNESAYKTAYESAVAKRDSEGGVEGTVYNRYREMARPSQIALGNDTLAVVTEFIGYTEDGGATRETTERQRLQANGYPDAFILHTREPLYYVATATCSTAQEALEQLRHVESDSSLVLRAPLPFVLQPAHLAR